MAKTATQAKAAPKAKTEAETKAKAAPAKTAKSTAPKPAAEKAPRKVNSALLKPLQPSKELGAVVGDAPLPRTEVVSKVWAYIKSNKLQNPKNAREIVADDKLKKVFGVDTVTMFEMNKHLNKHLS